VGRRIDCLRPKVATAHAALGGAGLRDRPVCFPRSFLMKCNTKTMFSVAVGLFAAAVFAYFAIPAAKAVILGSVPLLFALVCPISMLLMMKAMHGNQQANGGTAEAEKTDSAPAQPGAGQVAQVRATQR
jgi:hypothetical protein